MEHKLLKAIRTIDEFDPILFNDLQLGVELQDFTEPSLSNTACYKLLSRYERQLALHSFLKSMHGSFLDIDITSFNMDFARYSRSLYARDIFFAKVLNLDYLVFHSNIKLRYANDTVWQLFKKAQKDFFEETLDATEYKGTIVLENVFESAPDTLLELVCAINIPKVKANLDYGHAYITPTPIKEWVHTLAPEVGYIHLHSNDGVSDMHEPVKETDAQELSSSLRCAKISPPICLEYWNVDLQKEIKRLDPIL